MHCIAVEVEDEIVLVPETAVKEALSVCYSILIMLKGKSNLRC